MIKFVAVAICGIVPVCLFGQAFRSDPLPSATVGYAPPTAYPPILAIPGAAIAICNDSACTTRATTYTSAAGTSTCPSTAQVVLAGTASCVANSDRRGNFGFWLNTGTYYYTITIGGVQYGPYPLSVGGSGGGGGGNVSGSGTAGFVPKWLSASAIGNSIMQDNGSQIGIGGSPDQPLTVTSSLSSGTVLHIVNSNSSGFGAIRFRNDTGTDVITLGLNGTSGGGMPQLAFSQQLSIFAAGNDTAWINPAGTADQFRIYGTGGFNVGSSSALPTPGSGYGKLWFDSTNLTFQGKNASGTVSTMVFPRTCSGTVVGGVNQDGTVTCVSGGTGGVASVGLSLPGIFSVSGSPVTSSGTLAAAFVNQNANTVLSGPSAGSPATPGFRSLVLSDLPSIASTNLSDSASLVRNTATNNYASATVQNFGNSNITLPVRTPFTANGTNMIGLDALTLDFHLYTNNADSLIVTTPSLPTNGHCASWSVISFQLQLVDAGGACGSGGGGGAGNVPTGTVSSTNLILFGNCTTAGSPCNLSEGQGVIQQVSATNSVPVPGSGSDTIYIYWTSSGCVVGSPSGVDIVTTGSGPCAGHSTQGITAFPGNATAIVLSAAYNTGAWGTPSNLAPVVSNAPNLISSTGISIARDGQNATFSVDSSVVMTQGMTTSANFAGPVIFNYGIPFASFGACDAGHFGQVLWVTDSSANPGWGGAITAGGGVFKLLVDCDGVGSWRVMGL